MLLFYYYLACLLGAVEDYFAPTQPGPSGHDVEPRQRALVAYGTLIAKK
jgi:hypothetical protein